MDKANYAETALGYNNRNEANFVSKWFFWYLNPTFTKGSKDRGQKMVKLSIKYRSNIFYKKYHGPYRLM